MMVPLNFCLGGREREESREEGLANGRTARSKAEAEEPQTDGMPAALHP